MAAESPTLTWKQYPAFDAWKYQDKTQVASGGYMVYVNPPAPEFGRNIRFQVGAMDAKKAKTPFGHNRTAKQGTACDENKRVVDLNIVDKDFHAWVEALDEWNIDWAFANCQQLFKKNFTREVIAELYKHCLIHSSSPDYPDRIKFKVVINSKGRLPATNFYTMATLNGENVFHKTSIDSITRGTEIIPIISTQGLWFMSKQFGMSFTASDVLVFPKVEHKSGAFNWGTVPTPRHVMSSQMDDSADGDSVNPIAESDYMAEVTGSQIMGTNGANGGDGDYAMT